MVYRGLEVNNSMQWNVVMGQAIISYQEKNIYLEKIRKKNHQLFLDTEHIYRFCKAKTIILPHFVTWITLLNSAWNLSHASLLWKNSFLSYKHHILKYWRKMWKKSVSNFIIINKTPNSKGALWTPLLLEGSQHGLLRILHPTESHSV